MSLYNAILVLSIWCGIFLRDEIFDNPLLEVGVFHEFRGGVGPESLHIMSKGLHAHDKILYMVLCLVFSRDKFDIDKFREFVNDHRETLFSALCTVFDHDSIAMDPFKW